ncbi:MAG: replication initiation protein [Treponema sp.]|jgi:plasmid replication initiation protein|nr:replication initiation protein [Treponema sp.]
MHGKRCRGGTPPDKRGKTSWVMFHWFQRAEFNKDTGVCTMIFDQDLAEFLKELKRLYAKLNLADKGRLQSRYALRIYEMALSYKSLHGKDGNAENAWYIERTLEDLRKVIEGPVREINESGIGVKIKSESIKKGRNIAGFRFECRSASRTAGKKRGKKVAAVELPCFSADAIEQRLEKELQHLKELYPEEFAELYEAEMEKAPAFISERFKQIASESSTLMRLKERRGIVK